MSDAKPSLADKKSKQSTVKNPKRPLIVKSKKPDVG